MSTVAIAGVIAVAFTAGLLLAAIVNELERIADELARANALEQQRQLEDRARHSNVVAMRDRKGDR